MISNPTWTVFVSIDMSDITVSGFFPNELIIAAGFFFALGSTSTIYLILLIL